MRRFIITVLLSLCFAGAASGDSLKIIAERMFDGEAMLTDGPYAVLITDGIITDIGTPSTVADADRTVTTSTLMPGMIDAHTHVLLHPYDETPWTEQVLNESWAERTLRARNHMAATLRAGFTTIRDLGSEGAGYQDVGIRDALAKGVLIGPRMQVAGRALVATGSYAPRGYIEQADIPLGAEPADGDDLIRITRDQIGHGIDFVKVYADYRWGPGGVARPTFLQAELETIVAVARSSGRVTVAHAATDEGMRRATMAGVVSIEHGDGGSLETFQLMRDKGVLWCPTLMAGEAIARYQGWTGDYNQAPARVRAQQAAFTRALEAGVGFCMGSDAGVFDHGDNAEEMILMVRYGLSPLETLRAATSVNARLMGLASEVGRIAVGLVGDLVLLTGDPTSDITLLRAPEAVVQAGMLVDDRAP